MNSQLQWRGQKEACTEKAEVEEENMLEEGRETSELYVCMQTRVYVHVHTCICVHVCTCMQCMCVHVCIYM